MIRSISASGYRLLDGFCADPGQITVVIGANATGKSTLLDCLRLISECVEFPLQKAFAWHGWPPSLVNASSQSANIKWELTIEKPRHPRWQHIPLDERNLFVYEATLGIDRYQQVSPIREVLRNAEPRKGHDRPFNYLDASIDRSHVFDPHKRRMVPFDEALPSKDAATDKTDGSKLEHEGGSLPQIPLQERSLRLAQMRFHNEYPILSWIRTLLANLAFYPGFDVGRFSNLRSKPAEIRPETTLSPSGENLGTVLHEMLTRHAFRGSAELLRDFLKVAYPSVEDISAETAYGAPPAVLARVLEKEMRRPMDLWDLSDGILRFLCLGAALLNPAPPPFIAIDEPEAGLHPRLLPIVADMLKTASENTQVMVTTHSPDLLNRFDLDDVAVMAREGPRAVWRRPGTRESLRRMLQGVMGEGLGDLLRSGELEEASG